MNVSYNWLKELVEFDLTPEELAQKLTFLGLEVAALSAVGDDYCFELELTTNRPDCLSIIGVAREIAVACGTRLRMPDFSVKTSGEETAKFTSVEIIEDDLCPRYTAQVMRGVQVAESPDWLKEKLETIGVRPVNNVVDVTNYVTMEMGQPLHAFDYDLLAEKRIIVRRARENESITAINGKTYHLSTDMLAICDAREPVAIAGVMGGLFSEVTERTKNILLESAYFDPISVRRTARSLVLESAASYRFERGVDPEMVLTAGLRSAGLIAELAGGEVAPEPVDANFQKIEYGSATVRFSRIPKLLGFGVGGERVVEILESLGLEVTARDGESVSVSIPPRRSDISREADLIEEVLRHEGIENVPVIGISASDLRREPRQLFLAEVRERMRGFGYFEILSDSFVRDDAVGKMSFFEAGEPLRVRNPVAAAEPLLRRSLIPNMLRAYHANQAVGESKVKMFEASVVYLPQSQKLPDEVHVLAFLSPEGYFEVKGALEALLESLGLGRIAFESHSHSAFSTGKASAAVHEGVEFAFLGELSADFAEHFDLEGPCAICEVDLDYLYSCLKERAYFAPISRYPKVLRDMAVVLDEEVLWQQVREEIDATGVEYLQRVELFDTYRGEQLPAGKKSLAYRLEFQSSERTLTGEEVDGIIAKIASALRERFGAELRK